MPFGCGHGTRSGASQLGVVPNVGAIGAIGHRSACPPMIRVEQGPWNAVVDEHRGWCIEAANRLVNGDCTVFEFL